MSNPLVLQSKLSLEDQLTAAIDWGLVCISVSQEKPVGSYNMNIECSFHLTKEQAGQLRDWLIANV